MTTQHLTGPVPAPRQVPFFIVGAQRSGTTMLRLMLNSHSKLSVPFESGFVVDFYRRRAEYGDLGLRDNAARMLDDIARDPLAQKGALISDTQTILNYEFASYAGLVDAIFSEHARHNGKVRWGDKTPSYVTEIGVLDALFPDCKIVHIVRDGRDVAISNRSLDWGIQNLPRAAADWAWKVTIARKVGEVLRDRYLELRYEDLVGAPETVLRSVCAFLGEGFESTMLEYSKTAEQEMPAQSLQWHQNSIRAPDASLIQAWRRRMSMSDQIIFSIEAGETLQDFGYDGDRLPANALSRLKYAYYMLFKR